MTSAYPKRSKFRPGLTRPIRNALIVGCLCSLALPASAAFSRLPSLGNIDVRAQQAQQTTGLNTLRALNRQGFTVQDPGLTYYLEQSLLPLLPAYDFRSNADDLIFFGVDHNSFNAFALPGGLIGVHDGLLARLERTRALQAILAHELSHLALDHHARLADNQQQSTALIIASILLAPFTLQASPDATMGLLYGVQGLAIQRELAFSRAMEEEADRVAVSAMRAGGVPLTGLVEAYEAMAAEQRTQTGQAGSPYPGTHPDVRVRLADLRNRLSDTALSGQQGNESHALPLCWVRADRQLGQVNRQDTRCDTYQQKDSESSLERHQRLLDQYPGNPYLLNRAASHVADHSGTESADLRQQVLAQSGLTPDSWLAALAALKLLPADHASAGKWLNTLLAGAPANDMESWNTLARHFDARDERARALRSQAQVSWISGSLEVALRQIELAMGVSSQPAEQRQWARTQRVWQRLQEAQSG